MSTAVQTNKSEVQHRNSTNGIIGSTIVVTAAGKEADRRLDKHETYALTNFFSVLPQIYMRLNVLGMNLEVHGVSSPS
jgi:hypothetical protein